ncbi:carotenoid oxygenase family protein [Streptantibioticus silvisoli]|uniref:Dioxygenase n=1 Tax=Streptantibioticus silvisoli TaxID=2705255 RepID=A0ABT6W0X0_9ACTN|nr:carotenoid oxygenase family protein [Streptantibioticus silvisoli]MDI5964392.1 carotenoid oxygenase family protein [Streptantibioticus silvisoli]
MTTAPQPPRTPPAPQPPHPQQPQPQPARRAPSLTGHLAPVPDEIDGTRLAVTGTLPPELTGRYLRNGPNPRPGEDVPHWFTGPGMLHGVRLRDGRAEWYRNRWVRTRALEGVPYLDPAGRPDRSAVSANTHVIGHADKVFALVENGFPYEVTPDLETVGPCDFGGRLTTSMTAHPKTDPATGELLFFGYGAVPPYLTYHRLSAAGDLVESRQVEVPGGTMTHDFAITGTYAVWLDLPVVVDLALLGRGMPYRWDDGYGARIGLMRRDDPHAAVRWFPVDPCYVFHVGNAHEDAAGRVVLDAVRYTPEVFNHFWGGIGGFVPGGFVPGGFGAAPGSTVLHRWTLDPVAGTVTGEQLDDRDVEFPTHDDERTGLPSRFRYAAARDAVVKYDLERGTSAGYACGEGNAPGEAVFVPAPDAGRDEDAGWLLSIVSDRAGAGSDLLVLDAHDMSRVATVHLPRRVPAGFHGSWVPDAD